eukprot:1875817-Pleurochrysis_carterae.AAC.1
MLVRGLHVTIGAACGTCARRGAQRRRPVAIAVAAAISSNDEVRGDRTRRKHAHHHCVELLHNC